MFLGHFGVGAMTLQPRASLGTLFLAAQLADLVWLTLLRLGVEQVRIVPHVTATNAFGFAYYPFTHSLVGKLVAGLLLGLAYGLFRRSCCPSSIKWVRLRDAFAEVHDPIVPLSWKPN